MTTTTRARRPLCGVRRTSALVAGTAALLTFGAGIATAHDSLAATSPYVPAQGSTVAGALPAQILVNFQETFRQAGSATAARVAPAHVIDASGGDHVASAVQNPTNAKQLVITTANRGVTGPYTVTWTITSSDGDVVSNDGSNTAEEGGPLRFTVAAATGAAETSTVATTSSSSSSSTKTVIAAVVGVGLVVLIGGGAIFFWSRRRRDEFEQDQ